MIRNIKAHFTSVTMVDSFDITRFGRTIYSWRIFRGEDYTP